MASTRDRIIVATNELFRRHGYNGTSISKISQASEATIGSIYHFFPGGKEAIGVAVIETTGAIYRELLESIIAGATEPASAFEEIFDGVGVVLQESDFIDPCPIGTIAREVANTSEPLRAAAKLAFESWIEVGSNHLTRAGVPTEQAGELATLFVSTFEGTVILCRTQRTIEPLQTAGQHMTELAQHAISESARITQTR